MASNNPPVARLLPNEVAFVIGTIGRELSIVLLACSLQTARLFRLPVRTTWMSDMSSIVKGTVLVAALLFITISASINALFLSSFGRSPLETGLLTGVSIAGDVVKAVLPVVLARSVALRAWGQASLCSVMLAIAIAMSIASGLGFASAMRSDAASVRDGAAAAVQVREAELADVEQRLTALPAARTASEIVADIEAAKLDRTWATSKSCVQIVGTPVRQFCERLVRLRGEHDAAAERERHISSRKALREMIAGMRKSGSASEIDPQAGALAELLGIPRQTARVLLTGGIAIVLELGSIILILLAAGSALREWREPGRQPPTPLEPVAVPASTDRTYWQRQRTREPFSNRGTPHVS